MKTLFVLLTTLLLAGSQACGGEAPDGLEQASQGLEQVQVSEPVVYTNLPSPDDDPVPVTRPVQFMGSENAQPTVRSPYKETRLDDPVPIREISDLVAFDEDTWSSEYE
jgi:hypothetical protein